MGGLGSCDKSTHLFQQDGCVSGSTGDAPRCKEISNGNETEEAAGHAIQP